MNDGMVNYGHCGSWYVAYMHCIAAYVLKTKGKIIKTFLVFKETDVNTCKDLGAYAASMAPKLSTLAGVMILLWSGFFDQYLCGQHYEPLLGYDGGVDRNPDLVMEFRPEMQRKNISKRILILTFFDEMG